MGPGLKYLVTWATVLSPVLSNYPVFDVNTQMRQLLLPSDVRINSVIYRLRATDSDRDYPLVFSATDYGSYVIRVENLPCDKNSSYCEANVFLERTLSPKQEFKFRMTVRDTAGDTTTIPVAILVTEGVTDFNEVFPHVPGVIMIPENTTVGTELEYVIVRKHPRAVRQVQLELRGASEFKIKQTSKKDTATGLIILNEPLDYEKKTMYKVSVFAIGMWVDLDTDSRNIAGFQLVIIVSDVQDTPPVFDHIAPITKLRPNLTEGDIVLRVTAKDGDRGAPRPIHYGLASEGNPFTVFFAIDEDTGNIRLNRSLRELTAISRSHQPILLTVVAEEVVPPGEVNDVAQTSSTATVALLLDQLGNTAPYFASPNYVTHVPENSVQGTALVFSDPYVTEVRDDDMGKRGVFSLSLQNDNGTFEITPTVAERQASFIIRVRNNKLLDYEQFKELRFKIWAKEVNADAKRLSASVDVTVYIIDTNDNFPVFALANYTARMSENATAGTRLTQFEATDADTGDFGEIRYTSVLGAKNASLNLDPVTGVLMLATNNHGFDREESSFYQFYVEARDNKGLGNRASVPFTLYVLDVNDNAPIFERNTYEFILNQEGTNFSQRAFVKANDADAEPPNNVLRYEIINGNYGTRFLIDEETGELTVNRKSRITRQLKDAVSTLLIRAYDLGVPTMWTTTQARIYPAESGARVMRFLLPGSNLDRRTVEQLLTDLTGTRVVIHSIEPYYKGQVPFYDPKPTDLSGSDSNEKSIVTATVLFGNNAVIDLDTLQKRLNQRNPTQATAVKESVEVYQSETKTLFWILIILILLILLAAITLLLCCLCEFCPCYGFINRHLRKKSAVQAVNRAQNGDIENKSVQASWQNGHHREAWSADQPRENWRFNRRNSHRKVLLMAEPCVNQQPNIIFTREIGAVHHAQNDLRVEDVDGTEYRILDPSRFTVVAPAPPPPPSRIDEARTQRAGDDRPPTRDETFIRDGNAEILRLVTRGREAAAEHGDHGEDREPIINRPEHHHSERPFTHEEEGDGKEVLMKRFIEDATSPEKKDDVEDRERHDIMRRVMDMDDNKLSTADVNRLTTIQRDLLLTRFLVEEHRRGRQLSVADDTQSLPGVTAMATQTDSHAETQTDRTYFKRRSKSDNDDSLSEPEDPVNRRFKKGVRNRMRQTKIIEIFQRGPEIKTPIIEESENNDTHINGKSNPTEITQTKTSLLRHAAIRTRLGIDGDDHETDLSRLNQGIYRVRSMSDYDLTAVPDRLRETTVRSLQATPVKHLNITNNVLVEHVVRQDDKKKVRVASVPSRAPQKSILVDRQSSSEPRNLKKEAAPRYMEWYKTKRDVREKEKHQKEVEVKKKPAAKNQNPSKNQNPPKPTAVEVDQEVEPVKPGYWQPNGHVEAAESVPTSGDSYQTVRYVAGPGSSSLKNQQVLEKKSIFTIAYDDMEMEQIRMDTASTPDTTLKKEDVP